ncbi:hypothetical protein [Alkalihalobacillus sp. BA299]|nr:hypothetical protein [Alkalihalobacillus sp. BA299]
MIKKLTKEQQEKIKALEEELGVELFPYAPYEKNDAGEYYKLLEDDRL